MIPRISIGRRRGLSIPRLGLALIALTAAAWVSGVPYLLVRFGLPSPIPLTRVDGPHIYIGLAMAAVLLMKVLEVGLRTHLPRMRAVLLWQRWISFALLGGYGAVFASGVVLLFPWPATVRRDFVDLHLMTAVWAGVITLVHVGVYLRRRLPAGLIDRRLVAGVAVLLLPGFALVALPVALSPLSQLRAGGTWTSVGPAGALAFHLMRLPDGRILSVGQGAAVSSDDGVRWQAVSGLDGQLLLAAATSDGLPIYVGGPGGLFNASRAEGSYVAVKTPAGIVDSIFIDPLGGSIWIGGHGVWTSSDQGASWAAAGQGVIPRGSIWAFARYQGQLYAAGSTGVYRLADATWQRVLDLPEVVSLTEGGNGLWATSMGGGMAVLREGRWSVSNSGLAAHGGGAIHQTSFVALEGNKEFAGSMDKGMWESLDRGASWYPMSPEFRPGSIWQILTVRGGLLAATDKGLYRYALPVAPNPTALWWTELIVAVLVFSTASAALGLGAEIAPAAFPSPRAPQPSPDASKARRDALVI